MKDQEGNTIAVGDRVAFATKKGQRPALKIGTVYHVEDDLIQLRVGSQTRGSTLFISERLIVVK